jgi:secondary thiamine-phosphate synthase enzyme
VRQAIASVEIRTRRGLTEVTDRLREIVRAEKIRTGLLTVFVRHTSASLVIQENADPSARRDLERFLDRLVPDGDPLYEHTAEGDDDMPSHVKSALTRTSEQIPIHDGALVLGTWQGVYLWEHRDAPHRRELVVHVLGE